MYIRTLILFITLLLIQNLQAQNTEIEVEGSIIIGNSQSETPTPGTIRWTGLDFEGWNGVEWLSLTAKPLNMDSEGNEFSTISIGTQVWMAENLKTSKYNDGTPIERVISNNDWFNLSTGAYSWYNNDSTSYESVYGKLYNGYTVETGKLCPTGWHVPTDAEWTILTDFLGGLGTAGGKMKETGTILWSSPNTGATNESGWSGRPGGVRFINGNFNSINEYVEWWSSTPNGDHHHSRSLDHDNDDVGDGITPNKNGRYVRCLKN